MRGKRSFRQVLLFVSLLLHCQLVEPQPAYGAEVELDVLSCPKSCVCQYAAFSELPIARWVNHMTSEDDSFFGHVYTKLATCLLQAQSETDALLPALPMDLQALILLYTGVSSELTVNTSSLKPLNQLSTLEIRGAGDAAAFRLIIDEPMDFLQHANFEHIALMGSEKLQRPKYSERPAGSYDYKPRSEQILDEAAAEGNSVKYQLEFEAPNDIEKIVPYAQHVQVMKQTRMPSFYGWTRLEVLRVHDCQLNELHWQMFDGLAALRHLSLERNGIDLLPEFALYGALHIKTLSLAHNALQRLHYRALAGLLELETLNLSDNRLERLSELSFPPLPRLQRADFRENPMRHIFQATFWVMNDTRELHFHSSETALELWTNQPFDSLHKLHTLSMGNVTIGNLEQGVFKGLQDLVFLSLRGYIHSVEFDAFAGLGQLRELDLSHCGIRQISMDALMGCKRLERLKLSHNNLTHIPPGLLDDQPQLLEIHLEGNQLRTLPTSFFQQPRLRLVRLNDNPWECSCDMSNWLPRLTNAIRGADSEYCISDNKCQRRASFEVDKSLAPRCANYNGRSVYYVLRKQLHCGQAKMGGGEGKRVGLPYWRKVEQIQQMQQQQQPQRRKNKRRLHKANRNSLEFALRQQQQKTAGRLHDSLELSNEV